MAEKDQNQQQFLSRTESVISQFLVISSLAEVINSSEYVGTQKSSDKYLSQLKFE